MEYVTPVFHEVPVFCGPAFGSPLQIQMAPTASLNALERNQMWKHDCFHHKTTRPGSRVNNTENTNKLPRNHDSRCHARDHPRRLIYPYISIGNYHRKLGQENIEVHFTCFKSNVMVTYSYSGPSCNVGLCHQLFVPSTTFSIGCRRSGSALCASQKLQCGFRSRFGWASIVLQYSSRVC